MLSIQDGRIQSYLRGRHIGQSPGPTDQSSPKVHVRLGADGLFITKGETLRRVERTTPEPRVSHSGGDAAIVECWRHSMPLFCCYCCCYCCCVPAIRIADCSAQMAR